MSKARIDCAARARALVGTQFRPQGRSVEQGLDCVGLAAAACAVPAVTIPADYRLAGAANGERLVAGLAFGFRKVRERRPGDVLLMQPGRDRWHLGVWTGDAMVHADASLRAVVETPGEPTWPVVATYRRRAVERTKG